jgi:hypothetical protein
MIEANEIFSDSDSRIALWYDGVGDTSDLAMLADGIMENDISLISVVPEIVKTMWTYLEKKQVKILARYFFEPVNKNIDIDIAKLSGDIMGAYRNGANGVQIFVKMRDFERFIDMLSVIRNDLFFGHDLCIVMNILDINVENWNLIFKKLREIRANCFAISFDEDMGNRSDFIGRIYGMLQNWDFDGDLHFMLQNNFERIDQSIRLIESLKPELSDKIRFFLEY